MHPPAVDGGRTYAVLHTFHLITTIKNIIEKTILPGFEVTRDAAAEATSDALGRIQLCNNRSKTEERNIEMSRQVSVDKARSLHAACRETQKILHDHNVTDFDACCVKFGDFLHGAMPLHLPQGLSRGQRVHT